MRLHNLTRVDQTMRVLRWTIRVAAVGLVLSTAWAAHITDLSRASVKAWGPADGMLEESIFAILESPYGFIWIATRDGVVRFDGENFQRIARGDSLDARDFAVGALALTGHRIWLGGRDSILSAKPDRFGSYVHVKFDVRRFSRHQDDRFGIASFYHQPDGTLMIRRADGVFRIRAASTQESIPEPERILSPPPGQSVHAWTLDRNGAHWISTGSGVMYFQKGVWTSIPRSPSLVTTLFSASDGSIYMLGQRGLHRYRAGEIRHIHVPGLRSLEPGRTLIEDDTGGIWLGITGGVARLKGDVVEERDLGGYIRPDDVVLTLYQGRDNAIWCGTRWGGVVRIEEPRFRVIDRRDGLGESSVSAVAQDAAGRHWIATRTRGAYVQQGTAWKPIPGMESSVLYAATPVGASSMLLASSRGLWISNGESTSLLTSGPQPNNFARYQTFSPRIGDVVYYSDSAKIWKLQLSPEGQVRDISPVTAFPLVRAMVPGADGLWLLSWEHGLARFADGNLRVFGLGSGPVRRGMTLWAIDNQHLLVGTSEGGRIFHRNKLAFLDLGPIFPSEHIFQVQPDDIGQVWLLGRRALLSLRRESLDAFVGGTTSDLLATHYTPRLGLPSANFGLGTSSTALLDKDGELWLASLGGAIRFRPDAVRPEAKYIRCAILGLRANGAPVSLDGDLVLPPGTNRVQIQYTTAGPWIAEDPVIYYQLEGSRVGRMDTGSKEAVFTNLEPGHYRFRMAATLPSQGQSGPETVFEFDIEPLLYQRASVQILGGLAIGWAIVGGLWYRRRRSILRTRELEQRVEERTAELAAARNEAERARQKAEEAARVKSEFLATMSHEIRTPMNGVIGMIQLLEATTLASAQREQLAVMRSSGEVLMAIVNDMLDLSKIETGSLQLERVVFDLRAMLEDCIELFRPQAESRSLEFSLDLDPSLPRFVTGDPTRIRQVLMNLIGNGMKFTEEGYVRVRASRHTSLPDGVLISVKDSGIGIPEDKLGEIFKAFTQAESSTTRRFGGTGLGLAICDRLVSAMGGSIQVTSRLREGSEFMFALPLPQANPPEPDAASLGSPSVAPPAGMRVLVVEDNPVNRRITEALLLKFGCRVESVEDGTQAVEFASAEEFDAIFMDCHMPTMDGYEAARRIRLLPGESGKVPIIALTASASPEDRERSLTAGMNLHIAKPVTLEDLRKALLASASRLRPLEPNTPQAV